MHTPFKPQSEQFWEDYFEQTGQGIFIGQRYQRGAGIGTFLKSVLRFVLPIAKTAGRTIGKQALRTAGAIASDVAEGRDLKEAAQDHGKKAVTNLLKKVGDHTPKKRGAGIGKRPVQKTIKAPPKKRRKRKSDALGFYY